MDKGGNIIRTLKKAALWFDSFFENFAVSALTAMTLIVTLQVITRKLFNHVFFWSEEITILLLIWYGFMGIAIGFREHFHISMDAFAKILPKYIQKFLDKFIPFTTCIFSLYLIIYGWQFTVLMFPNLMPATEMSMSVQYVILPITGMMTLIYSVLQLIGINTVRHPDLEEEFME